MPELSLTSKEYRFCKKVWGFSSFLLFSHLLFNINFCLFCFSSGGAVGSTLGTIGGDGSPLHMQDTVSRGFEGMGSLGHRGGFKIEMNKVKSEISIRVQLLYRKPLFRHLIIFNPGVILTVQICICTVFTWNG